MLTKLTFTFIAALVLAQASSRMRIGTGRSTARVPAPTFIRSLP